MGDEEHLAITSISQDCVNFAPFSGVVLVSEQNSGAFTQDSTGAPLALTTSVSGSVTSLHPRISALNLQNTGGLGQVTTFTQVKSRSVASSSGGLEDFCLSPPETFFLKSVWDFAHFFDQVWSP
jgi:hypothetical protein